MSLRQRPQSSGEIAAPEAVPVLGADTSPTTWLRRPMLGRNADRDLRGHLERELRGLAAALHDVQLTGTTNTLDHLVVAPSGIWLIDVAHVQGRVTKRDIGTRSEPAHRLHLDGTDRSALVDELGVLDQASRNIAAMQFGVETQTAMCLVDAAWPMSARPFRVNGHWIIWPRALTDKIRSSGLVPIRTAHDIADEIARGQVSDPDARVDSSTGYSVANVAVR